MQTRDSIGRRRFLGLAALGGGAAALLAACGGAPASPAAQKPAAPAKPADAAPKVSDAVAKAIPPTPTPVPLITPIPQAQGTTKLLTRVHWAGGRFNDFATIINGYNETQGPKDKTY